MPSFMSLKSSSFLLFVLISISSVLSAPLDQTAPPDALASTNSETRVDTETSTAPPPTETGSIPEDESEFSPAPGSNKDEFSYSPDSPEAVSATPDVVKEEDDTKPHKGGQLTPYDPKGVMSGTGMTSCGVEIDKDVWAVALAHEFYDTYPGYDGTNPNNNPLCGKKIIATYKGKSVRVTALDRCHDCTGVHNLDLTMIAFEALTGQTAGRMKDGELVWQFEDDKPGKKPFEFESGPGKGLVEGGDATKEEVTQEPPMDAGSVSLAVEPTTTSDVTNVSTTNSLTPTDTVSPVESALQTTEAVPPRRRRLDTYY